MAERFDPDIVPDGPTDPAFQGEFGPIVVTEQPTSGRSNLILNPANPFHIEVNWRIYGNLVPLWLTALSVRTPNWEVTAYAESQGPGDELRLGSVNVPIGGPQFEQDESYSAMLTVPPNTLPEENLGDPAQSGTYKIVVTVWLESDLGGTGYDIMGYAEGPVIKVENPL